MKLQILVTAVAFLLSTINSYPTKPALLDIAHLIQNHHHIEKENYEEIQSKRQQKNLNHNLPLSLPITHQLLLPNHLHVLPILHNGNRNQNHTATQLVPVYSYIPLHHNYLVPIQDLQVIPLSHSVHHGHQNRAFPRMMERHDVNEEMNRFRTFYGGHGTGLYFGGHGAGHGFYIYVGSETDSDETLNDYLRNRLNLRGTKNMCKEGGCGACIVAVSKIDKDGHHHTISVNSCLVSVMSCHGWKITTIEGIGDRRKGYHPIQKTLAEHNGTQCGHCSPGFVMSMYSLLESNEYELTQRDIEDSFGSNTCRCTGYRPILQAFKTFAKDSSNTNEGINDIEDLQVCKEKCKKKCDKDWCIIQNKDDNDKVIKIKLKDNHTWYRVIEMKDIFEIFEKEGVDSYMLLNGNTGKGAIPILFYPRVMIDISPIDELQQYYIDQNLVIGAGMTLSELMELFKKISNEKDEFSYLEKFYEHLDLVAHIPVRNIGSVGGNLMLKHRDPKFSSDIFLLFESVGATLVLVDKATSTEVTAEKFLTLDMTGKVITKIKLPPLSEHYKFVSFKIMPRSQNAHAQVNAAFLYEFEPQRKDHIVKAATIVITGLSAEFIHAHETEKYLIGKEIFTNEVLQKALKVLSSELIVTEIPGDLPPEYRKKCALGLFYKGLLTLIPQAKLNPLYRSGARDMRKTRPVSNGIEVFDTNPTIWPVTEPMPKVEALIQCAGEAKYANDLPTQSNEVFCAFVTSDICTGEILEIDASAAMKLPGVIAFFTAKDIPGDNSYIFPVTVPGSGLTTEEVLADRFVKFYDQPIGIIVAETERLANRAALLVHVKYKKDKEVPLLTINDVREKDPSRVSLFFAYPARDRGVDVRRIIKGSESLFHQYHFTMEVQTTVTRPNDDGLDVVTSSQGPDLTQIGVSRATTLESNRVNIEIWRCGGSYGSRISRSSQVAVACSLVTYLLNRPCRFIMSIQSNIRSIGKRTPGTRDYEVGVNDNGEIQYMEYQLFLDNGYVVSEPIIAFSNAAVKNCYNNRRWQFKSFNVATDTHSNTYCRSPGSFMPISFTEYVMERIAYEINKDPLEVRLNNLDESRSDLAEMIETLVRDAEYNKRKDEVEKFNKLNRWKKRGLRVALVSWPVPVAVDYPVLLSVHHGDGSVTVCVGGIELGQGLNTKVIQTVAYTLNIPVRLVKVRTHDAVTTPNSFITGGSRSTETVCFGAIKCCQLLLDRLETVREGNNLAWAELIQLAFNKGIGLQTSYRTTSNDQMTYRTSGAAFTEIELDILTGEHDVLRVDIIEDAGVSMNPPLDIGQIEGAFVMGMGFFTCENQIYDKKTGEILTDRTWYYYVPLAKDIPIDFRVQLRRNSYNPMGTLGTRSVAEPPINLSVSVPFAIRQAIASSRADSGYSFNEWFNVDGPFTLATNVLKADVKLQEFLFY